MRRAWLLAALLAGCYDFDKFSIPDPVSNDFSTANFDDGVTVDLAMELDIAHGHDLAKGDLAHPDLAPSVDLAQPDLLRTFSLSFAPPTAVQVGAAPTSVVSDDFDGDGNKDLATSNGSGNNISVLLGRGDGTFKKQVTYGNVTSPQVLSKGFLNNDKYVDLVVPSFKDATLVAFLGGPNGTFTQQANPATVGTCQTAGGCQPQWTTLSDLDGDSKVDAVVTLGQPDAFNGLVFLKGDGNGGFVAQPAFKCANFGICAAVLAADMNGDGKPELLTSVLNGATMTASVNVYTWAAINAAITGGTPAMPIGTGPTNAIPVGIAVGDFNGDKAIDATAAIAIRKNDSVDVLIGDGKGGFTGPTTYLTEYAGAQAEAYAVQTADFNGDGNLDIASADNNNVSIFLGDGKGNFQPPPRLAIIGGTAGLWVEDFNKDGRPDLAVCDSSGSDVVILINTSW